jgi:sarcosine oxidase subunit alpha
LGHLDVDGRPVEVRPGDTIASAMFRAGVRTFTRSLKYHRRRGLYCLSGDCPNCLVTVDGVPGVRACETPAADGQRVRRKGGWPSVERDVLAVADHLHALLPVGFYSKTFIRPRWAWSLAERAIRSVTGVGRLPTTGPAPEAVPLRHRRVDVLVIGGGVAGLAAAAQAGASGARVLLVEEGRVGGRLAPGPVRDRVATLADEARRAGVEVAEGRTAVGIYEGPLVPVVGGDETLRVEPNRIVVATGAVEEHAVFVGNDLPGVWLGRGAARLAGVHGVRPAERAVVWARTAEALEHVRALREIGTEVVAVCGPAGLLTQLPDGVEPIVDGEVVRAVGRRAVEAVELRTPEGRRRIACDGLVVSLGRSPRDGLLRMAGDEPAVGAGEVVVPGCSLDEAEASGRRAAAGGRPEVTSCGRARLGSDGIVCLCEDVGAADLDVAWAEGWRSVEILKRYTTATMGPCQGALCAPALAAFVEGRRRPTAGAAAPPRRPPPPRRLGRRRAPSRSRPWPPASTSCPSAGRACTIDTSRSALGSGGRAPGSGPSATAIPTRRSVPSARPSGSSTSAPSVGSSSRARTRGRSSTASCAVAPTTLRPAGPATPSRSTPAATSATTACCAPWRTVGSCSPRPPGGPTRWRRGSATWPTAAGFGSTS